MAAVSYIAWKDLNPIENDCNEFPTIVKSVQKYPLRKYFKHVQNFDVPDQIISLFKTKKRLYQTLLCSA